MNSEKAGKNIMPKSLRAVSERQTSLPNLSLQIVGMLIIESNPGHAIGKKALVSTKSDTHEEKRRLTLQA